MHRVGLLLLFLAGCLLLIPSCGHDQELVSIRVQPEVETFGASNIPVDLDAGLNVQLRALGTFIHPLVTKDITNQVTWTSNTPQVATVDANGLVTATGVACGDTIVSATVTTNHSTAGIHSSGAIVTASMTATVVCFTGRGAPTLTIDFLGNGTGTVTSNPAGLNCTSPMACVTTFPTGTPVTLTASPTGTSVFGGWLNCPSQSSTMCNLTLNVGTTVTATFN